MSYLDELREALRRLEDFGAQPVLDDADRAELRPLWRRLRERLRAAEKKANETLTPGATPPPGAAQRP